LNFVAEFLASGPHSGKARYYPLIYISAYLWVGLERREKVREREGKMGRESLKKID
jgi:hypothetical protein